MDEQTSKLDSNYIYIGLTALVVGIGIGYLIGNKRRNRITHIIPAQKSIDHEERDEIIDTGGEFVKEKIKEIVIVPQPEVEDELPVTTSNVFADAVVNDDWDYEKELKFRSLKEPYVLHKDEFYADENGYSQLTLTYYAGDDILVDEDDKPIYNYHTVVGPLPFGHGSGDPKVVYIRNDQLKAEYEIVHDDGLYSIEVLGLEIEDNQRVKDIQHSNQRKFRTEE